jgi:UDP-N-acetylmuramoyl-L-alanyl-D-glutamate--2,6-diaminopimelate ligase
MLSRTKRPTLSVSLRRLLPSASFIGCGDVVARDVTEHSAECIPGMVFAAIPGHRRHGAEFIPEALGNGAIAVLTDRPLAESRIPQCIVNDVRRSYAELCHALYAYPSWRLGVVGVTGTNGKTTTAWLTRALLEEAGHPTGLLGTVEYSDSLERVPASLTTPDSKSFCAWLSAMVARRARFAAVELSSHALEQGRCAGTLLDVAVVTNITQDHFDYHGDVERYRSAKARILGMVKRGGLVVLNMDDPGSASFMEQIPSTAQLRTVGIDTQAQLTAHSIRMTQAGCRFVLCHGADEIEVQNSLAGRHNVSNCLTAAAAGLHFGLTLEAIAAGLESLDSVPGRLEPIDCGQDFAVYVDYAHTDDALRRAIAAVRQITPGRVFCVFGAGGDRDRTKRPLMGRAALAADVPVVTSDNPRSEDPQDIIQQIIAGMPAGPTVPHVEPGREQAIAWALEQARAGDSVLIAGKGHESVQIIGSHSFPFDDREVCRRRLMQQRQLVEA